MTPERKTFAGIRPLPPFGRIIKSLVEALQLPETYDENPPSFQLLETLRIDGTTHRYSQGDLLKDATKRELLTAVADALSRLGWLPFHEVPGGTADGLGALASSYEHMSDLLANIALDPELFKRNLARLLTVNFAVRAGAMDVLDGRHMQRETCDPHPSWADDSSAKKWIGNLVAASGLKRDKFAETLGATESPLDRVMGKKPAIPGAGTIRRMGALLDAKHPSPKSQSFVAQLRQHYAALQLRREIQKALAIDHELLNELIEAFDRIRRAVSGYARSLGVGDQPFPRDAFVRIFVTAGQHPSDQPFWVFLSQSESVSPWTELYVVHTRGTFVEWNELRHAQLAGWREAAHAAQQGPAALKGLVPEKQAAAVRRIAPLIAMATALEHAGDRAGSLLKLEQAAELAPELPGVWHSLGKAYGGALRWREAESAMRRTVELGSATPEVVGDLAAVLVYMNRADEAAVLLLSHAMRPQVSPMLAWTWAMVELRRARHAEALDKARAAAG
ncbi:MAG: hypothetical protein RIQ93_2532, partial [Verrucomicrobiota bacterium]